MARKIINIGAIGNDGTGDSIRDSFRSVNDNFRELYSSLGLGDRLTFIGLDDTPTSYPNDYENAVVVVNATTDGVVFKKLQNGTGIQLDFDTSDNSIVINSLFSDISGDPSPNLGGPVNAQSGGIKYPIGNLPDIGSYSELSGAISKLNSVHGTTAVDPNRLVANKGYVDSKISLAGIDAIDPATNTTNTAFGTMTGPLILSRDPVDDDDQTYNGLIAATKRYVDSSGYSSTVNLYVSTAGADSRAGVGLDRQGRSLAYAYKTLEGALKRAEELVLEAPLEIGPYKKVLTWGNGDEACTLAEIDDDTATTGTGFSAQFIYMNVDTVEIASGGQNYLPGDVLTVVTGDGTAARYEVLSVGAGGSGGRGPVTAIRQLTAGSYTSLPTPSIGAKSTSCPGSSTGIKEGCTLNLTFKVARVQISAGGRGSGYGLVSVRFIGGGGFGAFGVADVNAVDGGIDSISITNGGGGFTSLPAVRVSLPRFRIYTSGYRTDATGNPALSTVAANSAKDIREGLYLRGETSGALAQILAHTGELDSLGNEEFDVDIISGEFEIGETISYGDVTKRIQISVFVESGIYEENYPLRVPQNVAVIGDEFRRTIIRPKIGYDSSSPWAFINFRRDPIIDGLIVATQLYGYHYLTDSKQPIYPLINNKGNYKSAARLLNLNRDFIQYQVVGWLNYTYPNLDYNQDLCFRDVGLIIDSMVFDLKWGGQNRTISAALKYKGPPTDLGDPAVAIGATQLTETEAGILRINTLAQDIINNTEIATLYTLSGNIATTSTVPTPQILDEGIVAETGSGTVIELLTEAVVDVITNSGAVNYPKDNGDMDVFLCNDAVILRAMTYQGHGGFSMVLDPEGQVLAKSPYCQESASFSRSVNTKTFSGGIFVDGFTGNQQFIIDSKDSNIILRVSGLLRPPNTPCSFIVNDQIYRINYIRSYTFGTGLPSTTTGGYSTAQFVLDELTPYTTAVGSTTCTFSTPTITTASPHGLQPGAIIKFNSTGTLPTFNSGGLSIDETHYTGREYYVLLAGFTTTSFRITAVSGSTTAVTFTGSGTGTHSFLRIFEVLMPGNRSMLSNDFTQVCDLGYGLLVTNGGLTEAVSMFTYYCQISYYSLNGGQIRSVGGSSAHGNFALVAEGSDPLEVPTPTGFYTDLAQTATVYCATNATANEESKNIIYVNYDDFFPLPGSELEINHGGSIVRYAISTVQIDDLATKRAKLNISTGGGLVSSVPHGQKITIRNNGFHVVFGDVVNVATRPSTALLINDSPFVYRVLAFDDYDSAYDKETYTITNINYGTGVITTNINHRQVVGYTVRFIKPVGAVLPNEIIAGASVDDGQIYYIKTVPATNTFTISATETGSGITTFTGSALSGSPTVSPYGVSVAQLRENYDYIEMNVYDPAAATGSTIALTSVSAAGNTFTKNSHGLTPGQPVRFSASVLPTGLSSNTVYFVTTSGTTANDFSVSERALIHSSFIGVPTALSNAVGPTIGSPSGAGPYYATISNITCIESFALGMSVVLRPSITSVSASGNGTTCTLTFTSQDVPPYLPYQYITVSGFTAGAAGFNGTQTVVSCTNTTVTFASATSATGSGGTIAVYGTGALGTASTIYSISAATNSIVVQSSTTASAGTICFRVEGAVVDITTSGTSVSYTLLKGERGDSTFAIGNLGNADGDRIANGIAAGTYYRFVYEGTEYEITNYQDSDTTGQDYALLTVSPSLQRSVIRYNDPPLLKGSAPGPSSLTNGTLTIRISLTRVTSHDLLEIGTGGYADTNYPNEIYGPPVNSITSVPTYPTQTNAESGELVLRAQMQERGSGRTFFVTTDQFGNFNVGPFFRVDQGTGTVTFSASIALSQLDGLGFKRGTTISEFSTSMDEGRVDAVPTEAAIRTYIGRRLGLDYQGNVVALTDRVPNDVGFMALNGDLAWVGPSPMDMSSYKITNLAVPTLSSDAARLDSITISNLKDTDGTDLFNLSQVQSGQLLILDGTGNTIINATPTGEVTFDVLAGDSTTNIIRTTISDSVIDNANVMSTAAIDQTKLSLNNAYATISSSITNVTATGSSTVATITFPVAQSGAPFVAGQKIVVSGLTIAGYNGTYTVSTCSATTVTYSSTTTGSATGGTVSALRGISSFDSAQFTLTNGWATIKDNGLTLSKLPQVGVDKLLGNSGTSSANVAEVDFTTVVDEGRALRLSDYGNAASTGYLRHTGGDGSSRSGWSYSIVDEATTNTVSTLVKRDSNGDFAARNVDLAQLKIDSILAIDSNAAGTGGYMQYYNYLGQVGIYLGDGTDSTAKKSFYNNQQHIFRSLDSGSTYATINSDGITVGALKSCTSISSGSVTTPGTIQGYWSLDSTSRFQATYAADLAEYYEGDREYPVGTVLVFGGDKEVTISNKQGDHRVAGVVSDNAAYSMNGDCPGFKNQVALQGRVPCRVVGKIEKGDLLITSNIAGCAISAGGDARTGTVIGKALENYDSNHIGTIEVAVGRN
jgi:hypothetical protein